MEYEFTVVMDVDKNHFAYASKDRTSIFDGRFVQMDENVGEELLRWLDSESVKTSEDKPEEPNGPEVPPATPTGGEEAKQTDPVPEKRERTYKEWLDLAMQIKNIQDGADLLVEMSESGVTDYQIKAIKAILDGRLQV